MYFKRNVVVVGFGRLRRGSIFLEAIYSIGVRYRFYVSIFQRRCPLNKRASWASSLIYALFYEGALFIKGILGNMIMIGIGQ